MLINEFNMLARSSHFRSRKLLSYSSTDQRFTSCLRSASPFANTQPEQWCSFSCCRLLLHLTSVLKLPYGVVLPWGWQCSSSQHPIIKLLAIKYKFRPEGIKTYVDISLRVWKSFLQCQGIQPHLIGKERKEVQSETKRGAGVKGQ